MTVGLLPKVDKQKNKLPSSPPQLQAVAAWLKSPCSRF